MGVDKKGFTLIELLVVISIISILSSLVLSGLVDAKKRARDARRIQDIRELINGLALMQSAENSFPCHFMQTSGGWPAGDFMKPYVDRQFIGPPSDPVNAGEFQYEYMTFKSQPGGDCGQTVYLGVSFEKSMDDYPVLGFGTQGTSHGTVGLHCHIWYPKPPPAPCGPVPGEGFAWASSDPAYLNCEPFLDAETEW